MAFYFNHLSPSISYGKLNCAPEAQGCSVSWPRAETVCRDDLLLLHDSRVTALTTDRAGV